MGGVIFITTISLFHFFRNSQHPEKCSVSVKNFFKKCECISSCYLPISSNSLKNSTRKTSLFVLLQTGLLKYVSPFVTHSISGLMIFQGFLGRTFMKK